MVISRMWSFKQLRETFQNVHSFKKKSMVFVEIIELLHWTYFRPHAECNSRNIFDESCYITPLQLKIQKKHSITAKNDVSRNIDSISALIFGWFDRPASSCF